MENICNEKWQFDRSYEKIILGIDEAGRGPLAGPVVAAGVIIPEYFPELEKVNDSKKLSEKKREELYNIIIKKCVVGVGIATEKEIDELNILNATFLAMRRAISNINKKSKDGKKIEYNLVLVDGNHKIREYVGEQECVVKGDSKSVSIGAASIVAKVTRDNILKNIGKKCPHYKFELHKGYGTKLHREVLLKIGPCKYHRTSFLEKILHNKRKENKSGENLTLF